MSNNTFAWFWNRPPTCLCGGKMRFEEKPTRFICYECAVEIGPLAAQADLRKMTSKDKSRANFKRL